MNVVKQICNRVAVMNKGEIVERGSVIDIFARPQTETTKALIGNVMASDLPESIIARVRAPAQLEAQTKKCIFSVFPSSATR